ncbi:MAG TPA: long-chain-fatty-acid--CoA ligase [Acidimicrobiales bacterium]
MSFSVAGVLRQWADRTPDRPMLTYQGKTVTWAEQHARSSQVAQALLAEGVGPGDRVAFLDKNGPEYFEVAFGAAKINAVLVAVNWRLNPAEMAWVINDAESKVLFAGPEFADHVAGFESQLTTVKKIVRLADNYHGWMGCHPADDPGFVAKPNDVAMQLYTSGTTGLPKGAMLTNTNLGGLMVEGAKELEIGDGSVSMVAMPLFHIGGSGWALLGISSGAHTVVIREVDPVAILDAIERHGVTHAFIVPAAIMFLLAAPQCTSTDFSSLRCLSYGASPISEKVLSQALEAFGCQFVQLYGLTETTGAITLLRAAEHDPDNGHPERLRSCGVPFSHVELRVVDLETGQDQPPGVPGELWTRSSQNMKGYWHNDEATAATITSDGWLKTGDVAYLDDDGFVFLHDRVKDMIVSGGENIYPAEVENALMAHPAVADVAVIGVPDDKWGETVKACVVKATGSEMTAQELIDFARERIARYKCPRSVDFVALLPRNPSGKILKRELRQPYWEAAERQIH